MPPTLAWRSCISCAAASAAAPCARTPTCCTAATSASPARPSGGCVPSSKPASWARASRSPCRIWRAGLAGVALDETLLTLRGRDDTRFDRLALYRRFGMDARVVRSVLRVPRSRLGDDWQEVLLALLEETIAAQGPARPSTRAALAAGQS